MKKKTRKLEIFAVLTILKNLKIHKIWKRLTELTSFENECQKRISTSGKIVRRYRQLPVCKKRNG